MQNFRVIAMRYNIINIASTTILSLIFVWQLYYVSFVWYVILDDDSLAFLLFWPFLLLFVIIAVNKAVVKNLIHKNTKHHYEANNINYDTEKDSGTLTREEKALLPDYKYLNRTNKTCSFDMKFFGQLDDLGIDYKIDSFQYVCTQKTGYGKHKRTNTLFKYKGEALIVEFDKEYFEENIVIYMNNNFDIASKRASNMRFTNEKTINFSTGVGKICYNVENYPPEKLLRIEKSLLENESFFNTKSKVFVIFKNNKMIYLNDLKHKFKLKIPFLITKNTIESMLSNQKGAIYKFNMVLNKVALIFNS